MIDDEDGFAGVGGAADEAQTGVDVQGGAGDEQRGGVVNDLVGGGDALHGHELAEEHHVWFELTPADGAGRDHEALNIFQHCIRVRGDFNVFQAGQVFEELGVGFLDQVLDLGTGKHVGTVLANSLIEASVQVDNVFTAGLFVEGVHVLGDNSGEQPGALRLRQRAVGGVWLLGRHELVAHIIARPIDLPVLGVRGVLLEGHGLAGG